MNLKILLGFVLSIIFIISRYTISFEIVPEYEFWNQILLDLISVIIIFTLTSLVKTVLFRKRFAQWEIYQITGSFILLSILADIGFFTFKISDLIVSDITGFLGVSIYLIVNRIAIYGIELLVASYFLNLFQSIFGIKSEIDVPILRQLQVTLGLIVSLAAIGLFYEGLFRFAVDRYVYDIINGFFIIGGIPLALSIYLLRRPPNGIKLKREDCPELFKDVKEIADKIGVPEPSEILITPTTEIAVTGIFKKKLIIGIATLNKLRRDELKSILAHEFGHFYGGDTLAGHLIANLRLSLELLVSFTRGTVVGLGAFVISFIFNVITLTYSRQVEYRADIVSARIFGGKMFSQALVNYATHATVFEEFSSMLIREMAKNDKMFKNIYEFIGKNVTEKKEEEAKKRIISTKTSLLSTHPAIIDRVKKIKDISNGHTKDNRLASSYFKNLDALQKDATKVLTAYRIYQHPQ